MLYAPRMAHKPITNNRQGELAPNGRQYKTLREPQGANPKGLRASAMWVRRALQRAEPRGAIRIPGGPEVCTGC